METQKQQMTYGDLDMMINHWISDLKSFDDLFQNQLHEMNSVFLQIENSQEKINIITFRVAILKYQQQQLEQEFQRISAIEGNLENMIEKLENNSLPLENKTPTDNLRNPIYTLAETIDCYLFNHRTEIELLNGEFKTKEAQTKKDPVEQLAKVMMCLLEALNNIEVKMERMKAGMYWIDNETKKYLRRR